MAALRRWLLIGLFTCLALGLGLQPERPDYVGLIQKGDARAAAKEYSFAASAYRRAATLRPGSPLPLLRLGSTFLAQAWLDRAQGALLAAHRRGGWTPELHQQMGRLYLGLGLPAEAIAQWEAALAADPGLAEARLRLGWAYLDREAWDGARTAFEAVLDRWDADGRERWQSAHYGLGLLLALEDRVAALHHLQIAAAGADRVTADRAMAMGAALEETAPLADPAHAAGTLGQGYLRVEAWSLARQALTQALAAEPGYVEAMAYLGHALDYLGCAPEAERHLRRAVQLAPTKKLPRYLLGLYYRRREEPRQAVFQFRQALKLDPRNAALYAELGGAWLDEQNYVDAENAFRAAVELAPEQAGFRLLLVRFYVDHLIQVRSRGLPAAQAAAQLNPDDAEAFDVLGWAYYLVGSLDEAGRALSRAVTLDPGSASARYHLAVVQRQRGQFAEATYQFWRAIDLDRTGHYRAQAMRALDLPVE